MQNPTWSCPVCGHDTEFEQPACPDGHTEHGGECPEWLCVRCGLAMTTGARAPVLHLVRPRAA